MRLLPALAVIAVFALPASARAADDRQLVEMPPPMQAHMLASMRQHLETLNSIMTALAEGRTEDAAEAAETRLGMSSLELHGAEHMAPFMPEGMRAAGTAMHRAASRFATAVRYAEMNPQATAMKETFAALSDITAACTACHAGYRLR